MQQIGRYQVVRELGRGGMGVVYEAADPLLRRTVAIKTIRLNDAASEEERRFLWERLVRESQAGGMLAHPNVVAVHDILHQDGMIFLVMEYVDGSSLQQVLERCGRPPVEWLVSLLTQTADALDLAHSKGIVHRDVKPANLMVTADGAAKVADFGLARFLESPHLTRTGFTVGSPFYMAPEQVEARAVDGRTDQFALAVVAYEALSGERPFDGDSVASILFQIVSREPERLTRIDGTFSPAVQSVLRRALAKQPEGRFGTCRQFVDALAQALSEPAAAAYAATVAMPAPAAPRPDPPAPSVVRAEEPGPAFQPASPASVAPAPAVAWTPQADDSPPGLTLPPAGSSKAWLLGLAVLVPVAVIGYLAMTWETQPARPAPAQRPVTRAADSSPQPARNPTPTPSPAAMKPEVPAPAPSRPAPASEPRFVSLAEAPQPINQVPLVYPPLARQARVTGTVVFDVTIGRDGRVASARLVSGSPLLVQAARDTISQWVFEPVLLNGRAVEVRTQVSVHYQLQ